MYTILAGKTRLDIMTLHHLLTDPTGDFTTSIPNFCERWSSPSPTSWHFSICLHFYSSLKRKSIVVIVWQVLSLHYQICCAFSKIISLHSDLQTSSILFMGIYDTFQYCTRLCPPVSSLASQVTMNITHDISLPWMIVQKSRKVCAVCLNLTN